MIAQFLYYIALFAFGLGLCIAAYSDIKRRRISNKLTLTLALVAIGIVVLSYLMGRFPLSHVWAYFVTGGVVFILCFLMFYFGIMGGGDAKLIPSVALVAGPFYLAEFIVFMALTGGILAVMMLTARRIIPEENHVKYMLDKLPYGVAIAAGGCFILQKMLVLSIKGVGYV